MRSRTCPPIPPHATFEQVKAIAGAVLHGDEDTWGFVKKGVKQKVQQYLPGGKDTNDRVRRRPVAPVRRRRDLARPAARSTARCASTPARAPPTRPTPRTSARCRSASSCPARVDAGVAAVAVCREHGAPIALPRRRHQPRRAVHQHGGDDRLGEVLQPAALGRPRCDAPASSSRASSSTCSTSSSASTGCASGPSRPPTRTARSAG